MRLAGEHVSLRFLEPPDAQAMLDLRIANRDFFSPLEPRPAADHYTLDGQRREIERLIDERKHDRSYVFGIFETTGGRLIGRFGLSALYRRAWQNANLGYYVAQEQNGKGCGTEAVSLICRFVFEEASLHRVQAAVMPSNVASRRVLEKVGFRHEGMAPHYLRINDRWEDHDIFAMTREDWDRIKAGHRAAQ